MENKFFNKEKYFLFRPLVGNHKKYLNLVFDEVPHILNKNDLVEEKKRK